MMHAPQFWQENTASLWPAVLSLPSALFDAVVQARFRQVRPQHAPLPVICVGNFVAGGAGKTPTAIALATLLREMVHKPGFVTRGYGGNSRGPLLVDPAHHEARLTGDEALLLARLAPTVVSADRPAGARLAARQDVDVLIMDDGLQNPALAKDLSIGVIDAEYGIGNGRVMPAGPLRGSIEFQLGLVDALLVIGKRPVPAGIEALAAARGLPMLKATMALADAGALRGVRVVAYAGIGRPSKFFTSLEAAGASVAKSVPFADHHVFTRADARQLLALAAKERAQLLTTEKDFTRLTGADGELAALRAASRPIEVRLAFENPDQMKKLLSRLAVSSAEPQP